MLKNRFSVHELPICKTLPVGKCTRIWEFPDVRPGAVIGLECDLSSGVPVQNDVQIGDRSNVTRGVQFRDCLRAEDDVFIGPNATGTKDPSPPGDSHPTSWHETSIREAALVGANATIFRGITTGKAGISGAGSIVSRVVPNFAKFFGNPVRNRV